MQEIVTNLIGSEEMAIFETDAEHGRLTLLASTASSRLVSGDRRRRRRDRPGRGYRRRLIGRKGIAVRGRRCGVDGLHSVEGRRPRRRCAAVFRLLPHKVRLDAIDIDLFDVLAAHAASALLFTALAAVRRHRGDGECTTKPRRRPPSSAREGRVSAPADGHAAAGVPARRPHGHFVRTMP